MWLGLFFGRLGVGTCNQPVAIRGMFPEMGQSFPTNSTYSWDIVGYAPGYLDQAFQAEECWMHGFEVEDFRPNAKVQSVDCFIEPKKRLEVIYDYT